MRPRRSVAARCAPLALIVLVLALPGCGGAGPRSPASGSSTTAPAAVAQRPATFGVDVDEIFFIYGEDRPVVDRQLADASAAGLGVARAAPLWEFTEPTPPRDGRHRYEWRYADFIAHELAAHGFRWLALLAFAPSWDSLAPIGLHGAPRSTADYAAYAAAVAARYRGLIAAYEIWNEENTPIFWRPKPDPARYAQLYLAARAAIHRVDPGVPVLVGGLGNGTSFLPRLLPLVRGQVDGVAVHPYGRDPAQVIGRVRAYRETLRSLGAGEVPLYVTEYGWSTHPPGGVTYATAAQRGPFIASVAEDLLRSDCNVRMAIFYAWTTAQQDAAVADQWYGVAARDGAPAAVTGALTQAARALAGPVGAERTICGRSR